MSEGGVDTGSEGLIDLLCVFCDCHTHPHRDGGCLRCFVGAEPDDEYGTTAKVVRDVAPVGGRLVMFRSRDLLHEVRPTKSDKAR